MNATIEIIESEQLVNTPCENIKRFEVDGNKVKAIFWNEKQAAEYIKKYSPFKFKPNWNDTIGFANFSVCGNEIHAQSTYHSKYTMIDMIKDGLKF